MYPKIPFNYATYTTLFLYNANSENILQNSIILIPVVCLWSKTVKMLFKISLLSMIWQIIIFHMHKCDTQEGVRKLFSIFSWCTSTFSLIFMGYEKYFGIWKFHSKLVPCIENDRSLTLPLIFYVLYYYKQWAISYQEPWHHGDEKVCKY